MNKEIVELLRQGYTLLTPTLRLSRYLKNRYAALQLKSGQCVWESADILPWHAWLQRFWDETATRESLPLRLHSCQQQHIWLRLVQESAGAVQLLQPWSVAREAVQAWELSHQWQIPLFPDDVYISHDVRAFQSWAHAYQQLCRAEDWADDACLADILSDRLRKNPASLPHRLALVGFADIHPQLQSLLRTLQASAVSVRLVAFEKRNQHITGAGFIHVEAEIAAAANWVRQLLTATAGETIGIVVPGLQQLRKRIQDQFDDVLLAGALLEPVEPARRPYSIALGQSLSSYAVIAAALSILALAEQPLSIQEIGRLLRSPYIKAGNEEQVNRALLDEALRDFGEPLLSLRTVSYIGRNHLAKARRSRIFLRCVDEWQAAFQALPRTQPAPAWAETFTALLALFGWPGERSPDSAEYQSIQAWQDLLRQFASLDVVNPPLTYRSALAHLHQLATGFSFQPETAEAPVQVMGAAGAAAMQFDHLWLLGMHEEAWPAPVEPNAFIPIVLQRRYKLPMASAAGRLAQARQLTDSLLGSATDIFVSYAQNDRERVLRPSPLFRRWMSTAATPLIPARPSWKKRIFASAQYDYEEDDQAPPIPAGKHVRGGSGLFKDQAACPFRAFARHRLQARSLTCPDIGLDALARGSLLHDVMQNFWQKIHSHAALTRMSEARLETVLASSITTVLASWRNKRPQTFTARFISLEQQRLALLLREWLVLEKQRQPFKVLACEKKHNFVFADIAVHTRIDRIDQLDDGRGVIIDYKSGQAGVNAWFDARPDEPQLPLYAITSEHALAAIVFARIRRGGSEFVGVATAAGILPAVKSFSEIRQAQLPGTWQGLLAGWEQILSRIAADFRQGRAAVNPKNAASCRYCDLPALCRIHEQSAAARDSRNEVEPGIRS